MTFLNYDSTEEEEDTMRRLKLKLQDKPKEGDVREKVEKAVSKMFAKMASKVNELN